MTDRNEAGTERDRNRPGQSNSFPDTLFCADGRPMSIGCPSRCPALTGVVRFRCSTAPIFYASCARFAKDQKELSFHAMTSPSSLITHLAMSHCLSSSYFAGVFKSSRCLAKTTEGGRRVDQIIAKTKVRRFIDAASRVKET